MTDAREVITAAIPCNIVYGRPQAADEIIRALTAAGCRILGPDEVDEIAAAMKLARRWMPVGHRNGLTATETLERDTVDAAIRALGRKA